MQLVLKFVAFLTAVVPLIWATQGTAEERPHRAEIWLCAQLLSLGILAVSWGLRQRERASWTKTTGTLISATQVGMFGAGVLAMRAEIEHMADCTSHLITTKIRVPIADLPRYTPGMTVAVAFNPRNMREGVLVL